jgi:hypothetical protein
MDPNFREATVKELRREGGTEVAVLTFDRTPAFPLSPAFLFEVTASGEAPDRNALVLLAWCRTSGPDWQYETKSCGKGVEVGHAYGYQSIWTPNAFEAVTDLEAIWVRTPYANNRRHEHCLLTFAIISSDNGETVGYLSEAHGWISERAYQEHIVEDCYGVRARIKQGRVPGLG